MATEITTDLSDPCVWREIDIEAPPEDVWEMVASEDGRHRWLGEDGDRALDIVESDPPHRLVWQWSDESDAQAIGDRRRVELIIVAIPTGSRVIAIESAPALPLTMLASSCHQTLALA